MKSLVKKMSQISCLVLLLGGTSAAQTDPKPGTPAAAPSPTAAMPDRTTASFGDWILRCERRIDMTPPRRFCELGQTIQRSGDAGPQAQIALGRLASTDPIRLTILLPINITLQSPPKVVIEGADRQSFELIWMRCIANGCFATAVISDEVLGKLRSQKEAGRIEYKDGTGREIVLPISFGGFSQAFDAFIRESTN